jgi:hypothetical protein
MFVQALCSTSSSTQTAKATCYKTVLAKLAQICVFIACDEAHALIAVSLSKWGGLSALTMIVSRTMFYQDLVVTYTHMFAHARVNAKRNLSESKNVHDIHARHIHILALVLLLLYCSTVIVLLLRCCITYTRVQ